MKIINCIVCTILLIVATLTTASAQVPAPKVVVIPLNSSKQVMETGGDTISSLLSSQNTYIMSDVDVSLPVEGTCVVTATGRVDDLDAGDTVEGPYLHTLQQLGAEAPAWDPGPGGYALYIAGSSHASSVATTYAWDMVANTSYRYGCAFFSRPSNWADSRGWCHVTWVCSAN